MFFVYLIQSESDQRYYIGQTQDLTARLEEHNNGEVPSTCNRVPFRLIGYETYKTRSKARWREYSLKKSAHRRKQFIEHVSKNIPG
ncbi:GIY-YIG nuclease family protein [Candidatus Uhrbacteria bacterium]|nr:GIY-YIG nuclease family protein [Candidatus Uhrbacteria bacterium]